jgi:hypothetical protein
MEEAPVRLSQITPDETFPLPRFRCSPRFIKAFRKRHVLALHRPFFKRIPSVTPDQIEGFHSLMGEVIERVPPERLINIDETQLMLIVGGFLT